MREKWRERVREKVRKRERFNLQALGGMGHKWRNEACESLFHPLLTYSLGDSNTRENRVTLKASNNRIQSSRGLHSRIIHQTNPLMSESK